MNALAHIVRDIVSGHEPSETDLRRLSPQECSALRELCVAMARDPQELAGVLAAVGPQDDWLSPQALARKMAAVGPQDDWLSPQALTRKMAAVGPQDDWLGPQELARKLSVVVPQDDWLSPQKRTKPVVA